MDFLDPQNNPARARVDATGNQAVAHGSQAALNVNGGASQLDTGPGHIARVSVITAGTTAGAIYDSASTSGNTATNQIAVIPANQAAGSIITVDFPYTAGLVVAPGSGGVLAITFTP